MGRVSSRSELSVWDPRTPSIGAARGPARISRTALPKARRRSPSPTGTGRERRLGRDDERGAGRALIGRLQGARVLTTIGRRSNRSLAGEEAPLQHDALPQVPIPVAHGFGRATRRAGQSNPGASAPLSYFVPFEPVPSNGIILPDCQPPNGGSPS